MSRLGMLIEVNRSCLQVQMRHAMRVPIIGTAPIMCLCVFLGILYIMKSREHGGGNI